MSNSPNGAKILSCAVALAVLVPARLGAQTTVVTLQGVGDLAGGDFDSVAHAVSADGTTVVGRGSTEEGRVAFRWTAAGGMAALGVLAVGYDDSEAWAVSANGSVIVGQASSPALDFGEAFRWTQATGVTGLGAPPDARGSAGYGVSADGSVIVGGFSGEQGPEAFHWTAGGGFVRLHPFAGRDAMSTAVAVSSDGAIAGGLGRTPSTYPNTQAFLWVGGTGAELGGLTTTDVWSSVNALSADADIAVGWSNSPGGTQAFRWDVDAGMTGLGDLAGGSFFSIANACSADGAVVVGTSNSDAGAEAFIWTAGTGMISIAQYLAGYGVGLDGWLLSEAVGVSADGSVIVGNGTNPNGEPEAWVVTVLTTPPPDDDEGQEPEPEPDPDPTPSPDDPCHRGHHRWKAPDRSGERPWWAAWWSRHHRDGRDSPDRRPGQHASLGREKRRR